MKPEEFGWKFGLFFAAEILTVRDGTSCSSLPAHTSEMKIGSSHVIMTQEAHIIFPEKEMGEIW